MANAIFHYEYDKYDEYNPSSVNLGDYIQSIAASQYFHEIDYTVDRDSISSITTPTNIIGNGWYFLDRLRHTPKDCVNLLPVSIHINNHTDTSIAVIKDLSRSLPVGCRDVATLNFLQRNGVEAYFSSCLTTTIDRSKITKSNERQGIVFADLDISVRSLKLFPIKRLLKNYCINTIESKFAKIVSSFVDRYEGEEIKQTTHECPLEIHHQERFTKAKELLKTYATARCVFTSRIHCALPCLALGTPVILITKKNDKKRYQGISEFLNYIWIDDNGSIAVDVNMVKGEVANSDLFKNKANELKRTCDQFTKTYS